MKRGPFGIPVSRRTWATLAMGGTVASLLVVGLAYNISQAMLIGPISIAEAAGFLFAILYLVVGIGPLSPFRVTTGIADKTEEGEGS